MKRTLFLSFVLGSLATLGCQASIDPSTRSNSAALGEACQASTDCGPGEECEIEHGVGTCKPHGGGDPGGQADGGRVDDDGDKADDKGQNDDDGDKADDKGQGADDGNKADAGHGADDGNQPDGGVQPMPQGDCAVNADCGPGEECEIEHGVGTCKAHGGKK